MTIRYAVPGQIAAQYRRQVQAPAPLLPPGAPRVPVHPSAYQPSVAQTTPIERFAVGFANDQATEAQLDPSQWGWGMMGQFARPVAVFGTAALTGGASIPVLAGAGAVEGAMAETGRQSGEKYWNQAPYDPYGIMKEAGVGGVSAAAGGMAGNAVNTRLAGSVLGRLAPTVAAGARAPLAARTAAAVAGGVGDAVTGGVVDAGLRARFSDNYEFNEWTIPQAIAGYGAFRALGAGGQALRRGAQHIMGPGRAAEAEAAAAARAAAMAGRTRVAPNALSPELQPVQGYDYSTISDEFPGVMWEQNVRRPPVAANQQALADYRMRNYPPPAVDPYADLADYRMRNYPQPPRTEQRPAQLLLPPQPPVDPVLNARVMEDIARAQAAERAARPQTSPFEADPYSELSIGESIPRGQDARWVSDPADEMTLGEYMAMRSRQQPPVDPVLNARVMEDIARAQEANRPQPPLLSPTQAPARPALVPQVQYAPPPPMMPALPNRSNIGLSQLADNPLGYGPVPDAPQAPSPMPLAPPLRPPAIGIEPQGQFAPPPSVDIPYIPPRSSMGIGPMLVAGPPRPISFATFDPYSQMTGGSTGLPATQMSQYPTVRVPEPTPAPREAVPQSPTVQAPAPQAVARPFATPDPMSPAMDDLMAGQAQQIPGQRRAQAGTHLYRTPDPISSAMDDLMVGQMGRPRPLPVMDTPTSPAMDDLMAGQMTQPDTLPARRPQATPVTTRRGRAGELQAAAAAKRSEEISAPVAQEPAPQAEGLKIDSTAPDSPAPRSAAKKAKPPKEPKPPKEKPPTPEMPGSGYYRNQNDPDAPLYYRHVTSKGPVWYEVDRNGVLSRLRGKNDIRRTARLVEEDFSKGDIVPATAPPRVSTENVERGYTLQNQTKAQVKNRYTTDQYGVIPASPEAGSSVSQRGTIEVGGETYAVEFAPGESGVPVWRTVDDIGVRPSKDINEVADQLAARYEGEPEQIISFKREAKISDKGKKGAGVRRQEAKVAARRADFEERKATFKDEGGAEAQDWKALGDEPRVPEGATLLSPPERITAGDQEATVQLTEMPDGSAYWHDVNTHPYDGIEATGDDFTDKRNLMEILRAETEFNTRNAANQEPGIPDNPEPTNTRIVYDENGYAVKPEDPYRSINEDVDLMTFSRREREAVAWGREQREKAEAIERQINALKHRQRTMRGRRVELTEKEIAKLSKKREQHLLNLDNARGRINDMLLSRGIDDNMVTADELLAGKSRGDDVVPAKKKQISQPRGIFDDQLGAARIPSAEELKAAGRDLKERAIGAKRLTVGLGRKLADTVDVLAAGGKRRFTALRDVEEMARLRDELGPKIRNEKDQAKRQQYIDELTTAIDDYMKRRGLTDEDIINVQAARKKQADLLDDVENNYDTTPYDGMTVRELRKKARENGIPLRGARSAKDMRVAIAQWDRYNEVTGSGEYALSPKEALAVAGQVYESHKSVMDQLQLRGSTGNTINSVNKLLFNSRSGVVRFVNEVAKDMADKTLMLRENVTHVDPLVRYKITNIQDVLHGYKDHPDDPVAAGWTASKRAAASAKRNLKTYTFNEFYGVDGLPGGESGRLTEDDFMNSLMTSMGIVSASKNRQGLQNTNNIPYEHHQAYIDLVRSTERGRTQYARAETVFDYIRENTIVKLRDEGIIDEEKYNRLAAREHYIPRLFAKQDGEAGLFDDLYEIEPKNLDFMQTGSVRAMEYNVPEAITQALIGVERQIAMNRANKQLADVIMRDPEAAERSGLRLVSEPPRVELTESDAKTRRNERARELNAWRKEAREAKKAGRPAPPRPVLEPLNEKFTPPRGDGVFSFVGGDGRQHFIVSRNSEFNTGWQTTRDSWLLRNADALSFWTGVDLLKATTTGWGNPLFGVRNLPRDAGHILATTEEYSAILPVGIAQLGSDLLHTARDAASGRGRAKGQLLDYILEYGGGETLSAATHRRGLVGGRSGVATGAGVRPALRRAKATFTEVADSLEAFNNFTENWMRLAHRRRAMTNLMRKHHGSDISAEDFRAKYGDAVADDIQQQASWIARNRIDYSQGGTAAVELGSLVPYLNPVMQGLRTTARAVDRNPSRTAAVFAQTAMLGYLSYVMWNGSEDTAEDYDKIHPEYKKNNLVFVIPGFGKVDPVSGAKKVLTWALPIDDSYLKMAKITGEQIARAQHGRAADEGVIGSAFRQLLGIDSLLSAPPAFSAAMAGIMNYDMFRNEKVWRGGDVSTDGALFRDNSREVTPSTRAIWRVIGEMTGLSPARLQAAIGKVINGYNPWLRGVGLLSDIAINGADGATEVEKEQFKQQAVEAMFAILGNQLRYISYDNQQMELDDLGQRLANARNYDRNKMRREVLNLIVDPGSDDSDIQGAIAELTAGLSEREQKVQGRSLRRELELALSTPTHKRIYGDVFGRATPEVQAVYYFDRFLRGTESERAVLKQLARAHGQGPAFQEAVDRIITAGQEYRDMWQEALDGKQVTTLNKDALLRAIAK